MRVCPSTAIRVVEGGSAAMTSLDIVKSGKHFVSGGADKKIKVRHPAPIPVATDCCYPVGSGPWLVSEAP